MLSLLEDACWGGLEEGQRDWEAGTRREHPRRSAPSQRRHRILTCFEPGA